MTQRMWAMSELAAMVARRAPREALQLYSDALALFPAQGANPNRGDVKLLQQYGELALAQHEARAAVAWFDRLPAIAARLPELRDRIDSAAAAR